MVRFFSNCYLRLHRSDLHNDRQSEEPAEQDFNAEHEDSKIKKNLSTTSKK